MGAEEIKKNKMKQQIRELVIGEINKAHEQMQQQLSR